MFWRMRMYGLLLLGVAFILGMGYLEVKERRKCESKGGAYVGKWPTGGCFKNENVIKM